MASTYQQVAYGSTGDAVKRLQSLLNQKGYGLDEDGIFGAKTRSAVRDYQQKNGLLTDGIAGNQTWGHLLAAPVTPGASTGKQVLSGVSDETADRLAQLEAGYTPSADTETALSRWESVLDTAPEDYVSGFDQQLAQLYDRITHRDPFSYDPAADSGYLSAARQYARQGRAAMADTMGQAAALTGGYGSSYAQSVGQQAYGEYLQDLAELAGRREEVAYDRWLAEGQRMEDRYDLLQQQEKTAYDRWLDRQQDWQRQEEAARELYQLADKQDRQQYQLLLDHYADKARQEQKASDGAAVNSGSAAPAPVRTLSAAAAESLRRAMTNYLRSGHPQQAQALLEQYRSRLSEAQKRQLEALL